MVNEFWECRSLCKSSRTGNTTDKDSRCVSSGCRTMLVSHNSLLIDRVKEPSQLCARAGKVIEAQLLLKLCKGDWLEL